MTDTPPPDRLQRAEQLLDRWLDLFETALDDAVPDPSKTTELANVFTILRRIHEIRILALKANLLEKDTNDTAGRSYDPDLLSEDLPDDPE